MLTLKQLRDNTEEAICRLAKKAYLKIPLAALVGLIGLKRFAESLRHFRLGYLAYLAHILKACGYLTKLFGMCFSHTTPIIQALPRQAEARGC